MEYMAGVGLEVIVVYRISDLNLSYSFVQRFWVDMGFACATLAEYPLVAVLTAQSFFDKRKMFNFSHCNAVHMTDNSKHFMYDVILYP